VDRRVKPYRHVSGVVARLEQEGVPRRAELAVVGWFVPAIHSEPVTVEREAPTRNSSIGERVRPRLEEPHARCESQQWPVRGHGTPYANRTGWVTTACMHACQQVSEKMSTEHSMNIHEQLVTSDTSTEWRMANALVAHPCTYAASTTC
jgi:hypothetical protein